MPDKDFMNGYEDDAVERFEMRSPHEDNLPAKQEPSFVAILAQLAKDPNVDVDKMDRILTMQKEMLEYNAKLAYNSAMAKVQAEISTIPEDSFNDQTKSKYSSYKMVCKHTKPIYTAHGFAIEMYEGEAKREDEIRIIADIEHDQGHTKTRHVDIPIDDKGIKGTINKTRPHAKASSISYGRGYLMKMIFNLDTGDDDDGNAAGARDVIDEKQLKTITKMIKDKKIDESMFLTYMEVDAIGNILAENFNVAMVALKKAKGKEPEREPGQEG